MTDQNTSRTDRVAALADRLRLLQIDFADATEQSRREYLQEEVKRALAAIAPSERKGFLEELQDRFPTWDGAVNVSSAPAKRSEFDNKELSDASFLVTRLIELAKSLPAAQKEAVVRQLSDANLVEAPASSGGNGASCVDELPELLGVTRDHVDPNKAAELLPPMVELATRLDQAVWTAWRKIAPQARIVRTAPLQRTLARYVSGDAKLPKDLVCKEIDLLGKLVAALMLAIPETSRSAIQHFRNLSPEDIKMLVGSALVGSEGRYWRKYVELFETTDLGAVDDVIRKDLSEFVVKLIEGQKR